MKKSFILAGIIVTGIISIVLLGGCTKKERIVIYASTEEYRNVEMIKQMKKKFPDLDIIVQQIPTGNNAAKIKAEGKNIEADIIFGLEMSHMEGLKDNFADLSDINTSHYIDNINPTHNKYLIWEKYTASIIVDKKYFSINNLDIPKNYADLLKPEFKNLIAMPDPKTSGTGYMYLLNVINEFGDAEGLNYFDKLSNNVKQFTTSGSGPINLLKQGEIAIAMGMTFQGVEEINNGANFEIIELETGTPYNYTALGIINGKESKKGVKDVFNWLITDWMNFDRANYVPGDVVKNQKNEIANFPTNLKEANMKNVDSIEQKNILISKWKY